VRPVNEPASTTSPATTAPRSPWIASAGCRKSAGVPVDESVAATLRITRPLFPIPVHTTRPRHDPSRPTARSKLSSSCGRSPWIAAASISSTRAATSRGWRARLGAASLMR
jgi:hypothetical protein